MNRIQKKKISERRGLHKKMPTNIKKKYYSLIHKLSKN